MDSLEKAELTVWIHHITRFLKSGILIYNSEVLDMAGRKTRRRRRMQAIPKCYAFFANRIVALSSNFYRTADTLKQYTTSLKN